jgi:2,5-diketo-D-gluconate reductase B
MLYIDLGEDRVPALGFGTYQITGPAARDAVEHALEVGYRHIDTAQAYGNEAEVGAGLAASGVPREDVWLTTKIEPHNLRHADVARCTAESLRRLRSDYVDLLLIHWPNPEIDLAETLGAMQDERDAGRVRYLGVSNFPAGLLSEALEVAPDLVTDQVEYHPYLAQDELLEMIRERRLFLTAYSPVAQGEVLKNRVIREIAETHSKTPAQVALRWHLEQDRVSPIPKAASREHREANFDVFDFELSADEMERIHDLARDRRLIDPEWGPDWEE